MVKRSGLGRGLEALIPALQVGDEERVQELPIAALRPNPYQPRKTFDPAGLEELAASIRQHGVLTPILVRRTVHGYEIIAGERRVRASELAGRETIPAVEREMSDEQMMEVALIENIQREDLNPLEIAEAFRKVMERFGLTQEELARRMGQSRPHVANYLRLLALPGDVREYVSRGTLSMGHAKILAGLTDAERLRYVARRAAEEGWSVRRLEAFLQGERPKRRTAQAKTASQSDRASRIHLRALEARLRERLGTHVVIQSRGTRGKIEITYVDEDDLRRIGDLLLSTSGVER